MLNQKTMYVFFLKDVHGFTKRRTCFLDVYSLV